MSFAELYTDVYLRSNNTKSSPIDLVKHKTLSSFLSRASHLLGQSVTEDDLIIHYSHSTDSNTMLVTDSQAFDQIVRYWLTRAFDLKKLFPFLQALKKLTEKQLLKVAYFLRCHNFDISADIINNPSELLKCANLCTMWEGSLDDFIKADIPAMNALGGSLYTKHVDKKAFAKLILESLKHPAGSHYYFTELPSYAKKGA